MVITEPAHVQAGYDLGEVKRMVLAALEGYGARVWLFGSHARAEAVRGSDIDVAVLALEALPPGLWEDLRQALEDSHVLFPVDLVDLAAAPPELRARVEREGVPWRS